MCAWLKGLELGRLEPDLLCWVLGAICAADEQVHWNVCDDFIDNQGREDYCIQACTVAVKPSQAFQNKARPGSVGGALGYK